MTPTFKLRRAPLQQRFQAEIDAMYDVLRRTTKVAALEVEEAPAGGKARGAAVAASAPGLHSRAAIGSGVRAARA